MEPTNLSLTGAITTPKFLGAVLWKAVSNFDLLCSFSGYSHFYISIKDVCHFHLASLMPQAKGRRIRGRDVTFCTGRKKSAENEKPGS